MSLGNSPVATRDHHYRSTVYENKAICACLGACSLPTNGAVFTIPALSAFTFAIFTGPCSMQRGGKQRWSQAAPVSPLHSGRLPRCRRRECTSTEHTSGRKTMITAQHHLRLKPSMGGQTTNMARVPGTQPRPMSSWATCLSTGWFIHG